MSAEQKFKVKAGKHIQDGKTYAEGQVVTSSVDLVKAFPLKFTRVGGTAPEEEAPVVPTGKKLAGGKTTKPDPKGKGKVKFDDDETPVETEEIE